MEIPEPTKCILCKDGWASYGFLNNIAIYCYDCYSCYDYNNNEIPCEDGWESFENSNKIPEEKIKFINYRHKICEMCFKKASFNFPEKNGSRRCSTHAKDGMVKKDKKRCKCRKSISPCYGNICDKKAKYCYECKKENMIYMIDIKNKRCECGTLHAHLFILKKKECLIL
jgi:hypothetical protein